MARRLSTSAETSGLSVMKIINYSPDIVRKRMLEVISQIRSMSETQLSCCGSMPSMPNPEMPLTRTTQLAEVPLSLLSALPQHSVG